MGLVLITAATSLPIDVNNVASEILDWQNDSSNIASLEERLAEATEYVQGETCRQFGQATYTQTWDDWPDVMKFDLRPIVSITSVKYYDVDGTLQTVSTSDYWFDSFAGRSGSDIVFKDSFTWPTVESGRPSAVQVTFVAGYTATAMPALAKLAIRQLAMYWWSQREAATISDSVEPAATRPAYGEIPFGVRQAIQQLNASGYT